MEHSHDHYLAQRLDCVVRLVLLECKSVGSSLHRDLIVNAALSITGRGERDRSIHGLLCLQDGKFIEFGSDYAIAEHAITWSGCKQISMSKEASS
jgi:hypothetical protein